MLFPDESQRSPGVAALFLRQLSDTTETPEIQIQTDPNL
jgi:hypothetical protein